MDATVFEDTVQSLDSELNVLNQSQVDVSRDNVIEQEELEPIIDLSNDYDRVDNDPINYTDALNSKKHVSGNLQC